MKKMISILLTAAMLLSLAACNTKETSALGDGYPGTWEIDHLTIDGADYMTSELEALDDDRGQTLLVIKDGGKAYVAESGVDGVIIDWTETENGILLDGYEAVLEDGLLCLEIYEDEIWCFKKVSDSQLIEKSTEAIDEEAPSETELPESTDTETTESEIVFSADAEPVDGTVCASEDFEFVHYTDGSIELTRYTGNHTSVDIATEIAGYPVSRIGARAFENCTSVESIYLWADVISIGEAAFRNCEKLESFDVPSSVTVIPDAVFENCTALETVYIWGDITGIGQSAFKNCTSLEDMNIPSSCVTIGESAFEGCLSLESVSIWGEDVSFGVNAFANCPKLNELPDGAYHDSTISTDDEDEGDDTSVDAADTTGIRPEFKQAMEEYEAFFDEYVAFMTAYQDAEDVAGMMGEYASMMMQYTETMAALEAIDEDELSDEEALYYTEVMLRINEKLLSVV